MALKLSNGKDPAIKIWWKDLLGRRNCNFEGPEMRESFVCGRDRTKVIVKYM